MFHSLQGLYFERQSNGDVIVIKRSDDHNQILQFQVHLTASIWASIVSSMSRAGETYETWEAALKRQTE